MEPQIFSRKNYAGADASGENYIISSVRFKSFGSDEKFRTCDVSDLNEYESGCHLHRQCFGHMCKTPSGIILPPQSLSMRTREITTEYHTAAKFAFADDKQSYINRLKRTNYTKYGTMRCIMSSPVAGSCRLIATPQWEYGRQYIAISQNLASKLKVCRKVYADDGTMYASYVESTLQEDDWVIVVRPPSLHFGNTQPMRVKFWSNDCIGIHPESFSLFHGDFDGDEAQIYPVYEAESIEECKAWDVLPLGNFVVGRQVYNSLPLELRLNSDELKAITKMSPESIEEIERNTMCDENRALFINFTTLSSRQLMNGPRRLVFGQHTRNKDKHIEGMYTRFNSSSTEDNFVMESIRGTEDVRRQQSSQGMLGDMTRVAKISASCFYRPATGGLYVTTRTGCILLRNDHVMDSGTPSVRAISNICAVAQQAALDAHRAESHDTSSHDFIADLVLGCNRKSADTPTANYTFVQFDNNSEGEKACNLACPTWKYAYEDGIASLCKPTSINARSYAHINAAYNPYILSNMPQSRVYDVCRAGIKMICNYYSIGMSDIELNDIASVFSYNPSASKQPITTREGMLARNLGWIESLLATDYTQLPKLNSTFEAPNSTTAAMFIGNFNNMTIKHD